MDSNFEDAMVSTPQPRNRLENRGSKNDEMPKGVWKTVETSARKVRLEETEGGRSERESRKKQKKGKIKVFGKKQLERMLIKKVWDHAIKVKEGFMLQKEKVYLLSREEREEVREFIRE